MKKLISTRALAIHGFILRNFKKTKCVFKHLSKNKSLGFEFFYFLVLTNSNKFLL